jgi:transposase
MNDIAGQLTLFSLPIDERIPRRHPLRTIRTAAAGVLEAMAPRLAPFVSESRLGAPADQVLRAVLLWGLYDLPSERRLVEEIDYNLLYRWFVGLTPEAHLWSRNAFRHRRLALARAGCVASFIGRSLAKLKPGTLSHPFLSVNRPLLHAWAGQEQIAELLD